MARLKKQVANIDDRSCHVRLLLYADNEQHMNLLDRIQNDSSLFSSSTQWGYIGIAHSSFDDDGVEILDGDGKKHYHVYLSFKYPMRIKSLCNRFGFFDGSGSPDDSFVRCINGNFENALVYLTHINSPDKEQYSFDDLFGTPDLLRQYSVAELNYQSKHIDKRSALAACMYWINSQRDIISSNDMLQYLLKSPYFSIRNEKWLWEIWNSHNSKIIADRQKAYIDSIRESNLRIAMQKVSNGDIEEMSDSEYQWFCDQRNRITK